MHGCGRISNSVFSATGCPRTPGWGGAQWLGHARRTSRSAGRAAAASRPTPRARGTCGRNSAGREKPRPKTTSTSGARHRRSQKTPIPNPRMAGPVRWGQSYPEPRESRAEARGEPARRDLGPARSDCTRRTHATRAIHREGAHHRRSALALATAGVAAVAGGVLVAAGAAAAPAASAADVDLGEHETVRAAPKELPGPDTAVFGPCSARTKARWRGKTR